LIEVSMNRNATKILVLSACLGFSLCSYAQSNDVAPDAGMAPHATSSKATPNDRALAKAVRRALARGQGVNVSNVFVRARGGAVTLSGTVSDNGQINQAERIARTVPGVTSVSNRLSLFHGGNG
jgi:hyperosmotically inducible periplasmic protein